MIKNRTEWDEWFQKQRNGCHRIQREKLDGSIELKLAVEKGDFPAAENLVIEVIGQNNLGVFDKFVDE